MSGRRKNALHNDEVESAVAGRGAVVVVAQGLPRRVFHDYAFAKLRRAAPEENPEEKDKADRDAHPHRAPAEFLVWVDLHNALGPKLLNVRAPPLGELNSSHSCLVYNPQ